MNSCICLRGNGAGECLSPNLTYISCDCETTLIWDFACLWNYKELNTFQKNFAAKHVAAQHWKLRNSFSLSPSPISSSPPNISCAYPHYSITLSHRSSLIAIAAHLHIGTVVHSTQVWSRSDRKKEDHLKKTRCRWINILIVIQHENEHAETLFVCRAM